MRIMYNRLLRLYKNGGVNESMLDTAIDKGWISIDEKNSIVNYEELEG